MLPDKSTPIVWSVIGTGVKDKKSGGSSPKSPIMAVNTAICIISVNFIMYSSSLSKYVYTIKRVFIYVNSIIFQVNIKRPALYEKGRSVYLYSSVRITSESTDDATWETARLTS